MAARSARLALAGGCAAVLALAACSAGSSTTTKHASPAAGRSRPGASSPATLPQPVIAGAPGAPPKVTGWLSPAEYMAAYDTGPLLSRGITGKGQTIAIMIDSGSPTIRHDLAAYDKAWHLPAPPSFRIITPLGPVPPFRPTGDRTDAASETTLDVEAAHLMAPGAALLLVEIPPPVSGGIPKMVRAMVYVIRHHLASVMSLSIASAEAGNLASSLRRYHRALLAAGRAAGPVTIVAATGDGGVAELTPDGHHVYPTPQVTWPASDPLVVAVGGTELELGEQSPGDPIAPSISWPGSNGGRSTVFARPSWQRTVAGVARRWRAVPDISMAGSPASSLEMYATPRSIGFPKADKWSPNGGASLATPLFAGVVALAGQLAGRPLGLINPLLYRLAAQHDPGVVDVQGQGNTFHASHVTIRGFPAGPGYDLVTGLGTIDAAKFVPGLAWLALGKALSARALVPGTGTL